MHLAFFYNPSDSPFQRIIFILYSLVHAKSIFRISDRDVVAKFNNRKKSGISLATKDMVGRVYRGLRGKS